MVISSGISVIFPNKYSKYFLNKRIYIILLNEVFIKFN